MTREEAESWMLTAVNDGLHMEHGEVNMTSLAEGCAAHVRRTRRKTMLVKAGAP